MQVANLSAADLPVLSVRLPGSPPCGVGSAVTSARCSVNRGEHVDRVLRHQQGCSSAMTRQEFVFLLNNTKCFVVVFFYTATFKTSVKIFI